MVFSTYTGGEVLSLDLDPQLHPRPQLLQILRPLQPVQRLPQKTRTSRHLAGQGLQSTAHALSSTSQNHDPMRRLLSLEPLRQWPTMMWLWRQTDRYWRSLIRSVLLGVLTLELYYILNVRMYSTV